MSKELDALKVLGAYVIDHDELEDYTWTISDKDEYKLIEQALTPPTEEEVCKALSEYYGEKVFLDKSYKLVAFVVGERGSIVAYINGRNNLCLNQLPPHLVTLVSKFYENR